MVRIEKVSVIEQVIRQLQELITSGEYAVGDKLPAELELCRQLGVSRSTVREAYRMLNAYGMVEMRPGRGAFVRQLQRRMDHEGVRAWFIEKEAELFELMEVRMAVEPIAVRLAIKRATEGQVRTIVEIHERFVDAAERLDALELATLDEAFHTAIVEASNNRLLVKINRLIDDEFKEYRTKAFSVEENVAHALKPHGDIVEAILEKDTARALEGMTNHLAVSLEDIEGVVKEK
jgi:GntR family transcriptional regulator, transcriptional repressor for pyruvate dehydrogenase complex